VDVAQENGTGFCDGVDGFALDYLLRRIKMLVNMVLALEG
jgi:hypothetical protein